MTPAQAQDRADPREAGRHFDRGYLLARQGSLEAAIHEFERAYALSPHPSVLYNLGQAYAASGRAVEAVQTLRKYLDQADAQVDAERRAQAKAVIDYQSQRIGNVELEIEPPGAELTLDGTRLGQAPLAGPVALSAGVHGLHVSAPHHESRHLRLEVLPKTSLRQTVRLEPLELQLSLRINCAVPDVQVSSDDAQLAKLERGGLITLTTRPSALRFERPGYLSSRVGLPEDPKQPLDCGLSELDPNAELVPVSFAAPEGALVWVDGRTFRGGKLPVGRHVLRVVAPGSQPTERIIAVSKGQPRAFGLALSRSRDTLANEQSSRRRVQRTVAVVGLGVGAVGLGTAAVLYALNQRAYADWHTDGTRLADAHNDMPGEVSAGDWNRLLERENELRNRDSLALGSAVLGGVLVAAGAALWLTAPSAESSGLTLQVGRAPWVGYSGKF